MLSVQPQQTTVTAVTKTCFNRYYAFRSSVDGFFRCHAVVTPHQIDTLIRYNDDAEHFFGIEHYDDEENVVGSFLSMDIDFDGNLHKAYYTARQVGDILESYRIKYLAWFSGGKGFHIVVPKLIEGDNVHIVSKAIKRTFFNLQGVDEKIYRVKSLFRAEGSINKKSGLYKIPISVHWPLEDILEKAKTKIPVKYKIEIDDSIDMRELIDGANYMVAPLTASSRSSSCDEDYEPSLCIKKMWADTDPPRDEWHSIIYTLVKHFYNLGYDAYEIVELFDNHDFWGSLCECGYNRRSYVKIINSLSGSSKLGIGCRAGMSADCMQYYCSPLCHFNEQMTLGELLWEND